MKNFTKTITNKTLFKPTRWLIMALMLLVSTSSAWAANTVAGGYVYFDNTKTGWTDACIQFVIGHSTFSRTYTMTKITNTNLYYVNLSNSTYHDWNDATYYAVIGTSSKWDDGNWGSSNITNATHRTAAYTTTYNMDADNKRYVVTPSTSSNGTTINITYQGTTYSSVNKKVTVNVYAAAAGSSTYSASSAAGTAKVSGYYLSANSTATSRSASTALNSTNTANNTFIPGITLTATAASGYRFVGWYSSTSATTAVSTDATFSTSHEGSDKTYYARFEMSCTPPDAPFGGEAQSETICKGSPYEFDSNYKWYTGSTGETTVSGSEEIYSNTDYYIVNVAPEGCESARTKYTINVDEPLVAPTLIPTNPTTCNGNPTAGSIVIENYANYSNEISFALYKDENPTGIAYKNGFAISEEGSYKVVMTTSTSNVCGQSVETDPISIEIVDVTPTVNSFEITKQANVCMGNPVTLSYDGSAQSGTISYAWYEGDSDVVLGTESTLTIQQAKNASYKLVVTVTSNDCPASAEATTTVEPKAVPSAPTFDKYEMDACVNQQFTLPMPNNLKYEEEPLWTVDGLPTTASQTINVDGEYTYTAYKNDGCPSQGTPFTVRVNPLPTINIGEDVTAVKFEDVVLTATGNNITDVTWTADKGTITKDATDPKKAVLTYDQTGTVTVTATATSAAGCESAVATKTVTFSAENCNSTTTTEQQTVGKTKIIVDNPQNWSTMKCYAWRTSDKKKILGDWSGTDMNKNGNNYEIVIDFAEKGISESDKIQVIFNNGSSQTVDSDEVSCNKIYRFSIGSKSGDKYSFTSQAADIDPYTEPVEVTVDPEISAPAAKTISVSTTDGEGNIIFSGQVVKTGCDDTNEYGFQYSSDQQTWTTVQVGENATAGTAISNNTVNGLDGPYYVRAYITNDNSTQYGAIEAITVSTKKYPITTVKLTHVKNQAGDPYSVQELENLIYCVGDIVWFKLEQNGSNFQYYEWISYPGTELTGMYDGGMFKFKITESGYVGIRLRNDANVDGEDKPTWAESNLLKFNTHPEPTAPTISFATATICSNDAVGATLTLGATVSGQTYELWKYANDDDTEGSKVANFATLDCTENNQALQFTGIKTAGKYFVKTYYTAFCTTVIANSTHATLTVVNANDVSISITPATATTTPWMPVKFTVAASDDYTLEVPEGVEFNQNGNICSVKIPLPQGSTGGEGQYDNVSFPQDATTSYTVTAKLVSTGGEDNPCATPASATITLTPYVEECTIGH